MNFSEFLKTSNVYLDGAMGTLLQRQGLKPGELPERWNITHPEVITEIHKAYLDAGANVISTNTFGANLFKYSDEELCDVIDAAVRNAKLAKSSSNTPVPHYVALDIGPTGKLLKPLGDLGFEEAVKAFKRTVELGVKAGVDLIIIETMTDSYETKAALLAVKETTNLPVIVTNAYGKDGKLMTGASVEAMVALIEGLGADAVGANCSHGPDALMPVIERLCNAASIPVVFKPNAGLPRVENDLTVYDVSPKEFAFSVKGALERGARIVGGCCGTTPEHIAELVNVTRDTAASEIIQKNKTVVSSYTHAVEFGCEPVLIGERINPTGKKRFKEALLSSDMSYITEEGVRQEEAGAHILDVNVGLPDIDEVKMLTEAVLELQAVTALPLQIDTASPEAMESAIRIYNGKPLINSVNGKEESMNAIFPIAKKYGGVVIALTLDENGIPDNVEGRVAIARKILAKAKEFGIDKRDIVFDPLALTISASPDAALVTLETLKRIKDELKCNTSLGVSNISFGLPNRDAVNSVFFTTALYQGLSAAIMNPFSKDMMRAYYAYKAIAGLDADFSEYIEKSTSLSPSYAEPVASKAADTPAESSSELNRAISKGFKEKAGEITRSLLQKKDALDIVNEDVIPALDEVGKGYESGKIYLPQLLMSAEAAKFAFEEIKKSLAGKRQSEKPMSVVIATVKGDIHDIGKNIVKLLLENYGFKVFDLGKDVPAEAVLEAVKEHSATLVALSALMTTTLSSMKDTIDLLRKEAPWVKIIVGGAVLTEDYANKIGADKYSPDAMGAVRYAESILP